MVDDKTRVKVRNLVPHRVIYKLDEINRRVSFSGNEEKMIPAGELRLLHYSPGGSVLLKNYLNIDNKELRQEFGIDADVIEYDWTQADVDAALTTKPIEVLEDALDFAPEGVIDLIKNRAVALRIADMNKRELIYKATGADINNQIKWAEEAAKNNGGQDETKPAEKRQRRVQQDKTKA